MTEPQDNKAVIDEYLNTPIEDWPETLQGAFNSLPESDRSSLQAIADLIGIWLANGKRALTYDEIFKAE